MIAEGIDKLLGLFKQAHEHPVLQLKGDRPGRFYRQDADGELHFFEVEPGDRIIAGASLADIVRNATTPYLDNAQLVDGLITYGVNYATLYFDQDNGRELMKWQANESRELAVFREWFEAGEDGITLTVDEAVQLFDTFLRPCIPGPDWLKQISLLKIQSETASEAARDATSSMAGGLVKSQVTSPMPQGEVEFKVRLIDDPDFPRIPLRCYVRADLNYRKWLFMPIDDSWHAMLKKQAEEVASRLAPAKEYVTDIVRGGLTFKAS